MFSDLRVVFLALLIAVVACSDPNEKANALFVEAELIIQQASAESDAERHLEQLNQAHAKLQRIVNQYASADLAVRLVSGQSVGTISLDGLQSTIKTAEIAALKQRAAREKERARE